VNLFEEVPASRKFDLGEAGSIARPGRPVLDDFSPGRQEGLARIDRQQAYPVEGDRAAGPGWR